VLIKQCKSDLDEAINLKAFHILWS